MVARSSAAFAAARRHAKASKRVVVDITAGSICSTPLMLSRPFRPKTSKRRSIASDGPIGRDAGMRDGSNAIIPICPKLGAYWGKNHAVIHQ